MASEIVTDHRLHPISGLRSVIDAAPGPLVLLLAAAVAMVADIPQVRPEQMTDTGLVSVLPLGWFLSLGLIVISFVWTLVDERCPNWLRTAHILMFIVLIHGTPAMVYGTLRYSWAWKHIGVIEYFQRKGALNPSEPVLGPYHNWPGFFTLWAFATKFAGAKSALAFASWAPVYFNVAMLAPLTAFYRSFTRDNRLVALALWIFYIGSWVGQDYFAPQALNFILYIVILVLWLRFLDPSLTDISRSVRRSATVLLLLLEATVASSHQLTPVMMTMALVVFALLRRGRGWLFATSSAIITIGWLATGARTFMSDNVQAVLKTMGSLSSNANSTFIDLAQASSGQLLVAKMDRALSISILLLAAVGVVRLRGARMSWVPLGLLAVPLSLLGASSYGGEIVFRVYLFALPAAAFFGAVALAPTWGTRLWSIPRAVLICAVSMALLVGMLFAYYGKERMFHFTRQEVRGSQWLYDNAPAGSLIIGVTSNLPWAFTHYEQYQYRWLGTEDPSTRLQLIEDPIGAINAAIDAKPAVNEYVILNRGQRVEMEATGKLPVGAVERIGVALRTSARFTVVFDNPDVTVLQRVGP